MKRTVCFLSALFLTSVSIAANPQGIRPKGAVDRYTASREENGHNLGAHLLSDLEVIQRFSSDLKDTYLVVEVALYPGDDELDVVVGDFALQVSDKKRKLTLPAEDPAGIDAPERKGGIAVLSSRSQRVGYPSSGGLGRRSRGPRPITSTGVGVGRRETVPGRVDLRTGTEAEAKGLPEGVAVDSVAGYLYFKLEKREKKARYELQYTLKGKTIRLELPRR